MNTSEYMDKQIMDLSNSMNNNNNNNDFINLMNLHHITDATKIEKNTLRNREFQSIRGTGSLPGWDFYGLESNTAAISLPRKSTTITGYHPTPTRNNCQNYGFLDSTEPAELSVEEDLSSVDASLLSEVDRRLKKYTDNLLHAIESVSARLSQLETRSRQIETSVDELKLSVDNNHGNTDGKLRLVENILREVQDGVQVIKNKQDIMDTQLQLAKFQFPKLEQKVDTHNNTSVDSAQSTASTSLQSHQQFPPFALPQPPSTLPPPNAPPPPPQQNLPSQVQLQNQFPQNQIPSGTQRETYFPPTGHAPENSSQQYQLPAPQQLQTSIPPPPHQQYQPSPSQLYSQPPPPPQSHSPLSSSGAPASQQLYAAPPTMFEPSSSRPSPGFSGAYGPSAGPGESYPYSGSSVQYGSGGSALKSQQLGSPAMGQSGGTGYPQLPTARILPQALPTASAVSSGSSSPRTGNRVPIDDVVDRVTNMGFPRDQVRATVRRLTENGQSVDLNVVLDKLMNDGEGQPPQGWYGR